LSNDLLEAAAAEFARFQDASGAVDEAAAELMGVNLTDLRCLSRLHAAGPSTAGDLAAAAGLTRGAMTTAIDRLERAGYVARVRGEADRRTVRVQPTSAARGVVEQIWGPIAAAGRSVLARYSPAELALLADALREARELQEHEVERIRALSIERPRSPGGA
jgi:DNA-binding MarR family transcriptional regulator